MTAVKKRILVVNYMEVRAKLHGEPIKDMEGNNLVILNIGKDTKKLHKIYNDFNDKELLLDIKRYKQLRTNEQNRLFWKCVSILATALNNDNWDQYLMELERYGKYNNVIIRKDAYDDFRNMWRETKVVGERRDKDGVEYYDVNCYYGSSTYDTSEMTRLINGVKQDMSDAGLDIPVI